VVVSSDDALLSMGGGVSAAIRRAGSASIATDAAKLRPARVGDVIVSTAGNLPAKYVLHAITLDFGDSGLPMDLIVRQTTHRVMQLLPLLGCTSVAFPAIGAGVARIPYDVVASQMATVLVDNLIDDPAAYRVELWLSDEAGHLKPRAFFAFFEAFATRLMGVATAAAPGMVILQPPSASPTPTDAHQVAESERHHRVYEMLRHLDARRDQLETRLLAALAATDDRADRLVPQLRSHLVDVEQLRSTYAAELAMLDQGSMQDSRARSSSARPMSISAITASRCAASSTACRCGLSAWKSSPRRSMPRSASSARRWWRARSTAAFSACAMAPSIRAQVSR
jgi:O-acetyl-ADP-ribose deacetylase (regulator of RNase III)